MFGSLEAFAALFAVAVQGIEDDGVGLSGGTDIIDLDSFAFELFVVLKKAAEHQEAMRRHLGRLVVGVEFRVLCGDGDDFMIGLALVDHGHQSDRASVDDRQWNDGFLAENKNVERIVIFGEGLWDESVVSGIVNGRIEDAVESDEAAVFVELVLHAGAEGDFDDAVEFLREFVAGGYVMPRMNHTWV